MEKPRNSPARFSGRKTRVAGSSFPSLEIPAFIRSMIARIGVLNISDRASAGVYEDTPGKNLVALLRDWLATAFHLEYAVIPDDRATIESELRRLADQADCCLILTTGGTGPAPRDVTPEATAAVCDKLLPGFGELMRSASLKFVPTAILSRQTAGVRGQTLIVNLPGRPKAIRENLEAVFPAIPYCIDLIGGPRLETNESQIKAFRPKA
jgi:molybdopterin adenylyltransferase